MSRLHLSLLFGPALLVACGGGAATPPVQEPQPMVVTGPIDWKGDEDLAPVLVQPELTPYVLEGAERVELRVGPFDFIERLAVVVEDTTAPWLVRLNALRLLASRGALSELPVFATAMHASDERVRIAAVSSMREFMSIRPEPAMQILALGLKDPSTRVQTAALQMLGDRNVVLLRDFYARSQNREVKTITLDLIRAAEERGAPLVPAADGSLERMTSGGAKLSFKPAMRWADWDAAVGDVTVTPAGGKPMLVASGIEVVGNVVPVFFTNEGKTIVYEKNRVIYARELAGGDERRLGDGIAPRVLPFTSDVIFFTEVRNRRSETPNSFGLKYEVMRIPAAGGAAVSVGQIGASALNALKGNYSTLRWARIEEQEGTFFLIGELIDPYKLPSPFGGS